MKKTFTILVAVLLTANLVLPHLADAQTPQVFKYQTVVHDGNGNILPSTNVAIKLSIQEGQPGGQSVYWERHIVTTNQFGLANLEFGNGGTLSGGDWNNIDWGNQNYYVGVDLDPNGGTNYTPMGSSQLVSVPYAMYAESANIDGSETVVTGGLNIIVNGNGTIPDPYVIQTCGHYPGELFGGGGVFWVNHTGQHGLICSMIDLDTSQVWSNVDDVLIGNLAQSHWNGQGNSIAIVNQQGHTTSAAKLCLDYTNDDYGTGTFGDWYLPAIAEFNHLGNNIYEVQKALDTDGNPATTPVTTNVYWSSTESAGSSAWGCGISADSSHYGVKSELLFVRAVRAF